MSVGQLRKEWRQFKNNHPEFEKEKTFKADLGPHLDKMEKVISGWVATQEAATKDLMNAQGLWVTVKSIMKAYYGVAAVKSLKDFKEFKEEIEGLDDILMDLGKQQIALINALKKMQ